MAAQLQVCFTTRLPQHLRVESRALNLPAFLNRYGLSQIINTLLGLEKPQPFDFLIQGELLRTTLEEFYLAKGISAESTLTIEYIAAVGPPELQQSQQQSDWVSAVDGSHPSLILTGSYDCVARAWTADGVCSFLFEGHTDAITAIALASAEDSDDLKVVTASKDRTLRLWQTVNEVKVFKGHTSSVQCVSVSPSGKQICSGSWDSTMKLWKSDSHQEDDDNEENQLTKKLKTNADAAKAFEHQVHAYTTCKGHTQCVSAVDWSEEDTIYSASWDHSLRQWDVETGADTLTLTCTKALHCLSVGGDGCALLAAAGADPVIRIWDPRVPGTVTPAIQLTSHKAWVSACKWHRESRNHLLSASHDGNLKLWDIRSKVPLQTIEAHSDKVLSTDWWKGDAIVSGGADSKLNIFTYSELIQGNDRTK